MERFFKPEEKVERFIFILIANADALGCERNRRGFDGTGRGDEGG